MEDYQFLEGKLYIISFYDHCIGSMSPVECKVCGWVMRSNKKCVVLTAWKVQNQDKETTDSNSEPVVILKSTIIKVRKITR